jgi:RNA polymerase-binding transcription factor DksA
MAKNKSKSAATQKPAAQSKAGTTTKAASASLPAAEVKRTADTMEKPSKKTALRESILARKAATKPIAFSLDEVRAIAKTNASKAVEVPAKPAKGALKDSKAKPGTGKAIAAKQPVVLEKPAKPNHVKAASLADILGFNPKKAKSVEVIEEGSIPEKYRRYYRILVDMRAQLTEGIERHSEESLKRSAKDDAGDLSAYGQNMADGGINTFDRDFVLSLVSSEQEALSEIDSAIKRIRDGTYGICEVTGKQIAKERLLAVPFTRYSTEAQKEIEKNRYRSRAQSDLFGEMGDEGAKLVEDDAGGEE